MTKSEVKFFKALGDETRLSIVKYLLNMEIFACDFTAFTKKDQSTVSRHLKVLVEAGIIKNQKKGRNIIYSIKNNAMQKKLLSMGIEPVNGDHACCVRPVEVQL